MKKTRLFSAMLGFGIVVVAIGGCARTVEYEPLAETPSSDRLEAKAAAPSPETKEVPAANQSPTGTASKTAKTKTNSNANEIQFAESYEAAVETARREGKPLMIDFYTDWCGVCKMMDKEVFNQKSIVQESQKFVNVKVNAEKRDDLARTFGVGGYPTFIWLDTNGNIIDRLDRGAPAGEFLTRMQTAHAKFSPAVQL